jgi:hypothetical protein
VTGSFNNSITLTEAQNTGIFDKSVWDPRIPQTSVNILVLALLWDSILPENDLTIEYKAGWGYVLYGAIRVFRRCSWQEIFDRWSCS